MFIELHTYVAQKKAASLADEFAILEAEFKALEKEYKAKKEEVLKACMAAADADLKATVNGDHFSLHYSMTPTTSFKLERAIELGYITKAQIEECKIGSTRQNLTVKARAKIIA